MADGNAYSTITGMVCAITGASVLVGTAKSLFTEDCDRCCGFGRVLCPQCKGSGVLDSAQGRKSEKAFGSAFGQVEEGQYLCPFCKKDGVIKCRTCKGRSWKPTFFLNVERLVGLQGPNYEHSKFIRRIKMEERELPGSGSSKQKGFILGGSEMELAQHQQFNQ